ncbi:MAG: Gfo/Idh/MocA family oxidoreductase [Firmicutes bacterium]|nr:Gfo/Idh/MocA family oxidoreductase [Bacillota bacterium]
MIRVGVIGYGTMGQVHSQSYKELENAALTAVADQEPKRREQIEQELGVKAVSNADEIFQDESIDLVDICVPTYLHEEMIAKAVEAGKHIFVEKPLARSLDQGKKILALTKNYRKKVGVGHVVRFSPEYVAARESVQQGEIGRPAVVRTFRGGSQFPRGWQDWYADFELSGGVILDLVIHDIDYLRWVFGEVERVYAKSTHGRTTAHLEHAMIVLRFKNGVIAHVEGSWTNYPGQFYTTFEFSGDEGLISFDSRKTAPIVQITAKQSEDSKDVVIPENPFLVSPYTAEIADMVEAIKDDREPAVTVQDAFDTLRVALAAVESAQTGKVISL